MKSLLQIGAGKIGRSFIAQVFAKGGYKVIFADNNEELVHLINQQKSYSIHIVGNYSTDKITISNIRATHTGSVAEMREVVINADIISVSVGKTNLPGLCKNLARSIHARFKERPQNPVDIIIAENIRFGATYLRDELRKHLSGVPLNDYVGFVESSIGKMVPIQQANFNSLDVNAESYNDLIVDKLAFLTPIPEIADLKPKKNMKAWVDRKIFIHNLGHAALAYQSYDTYPEIITTYEALKKENIREITRSTMLQAAEILLASYPEVFTRKELEAHIDDLLIRFANKALGDTIHRVGCDLSRKLQSDDRLMIPILAGIRLGKPVQLILEAWKKGCSFSAGDIHGNLYPDDIAFQQKYDRNPMTILKEHCILKPEDKDILISLLSRI